MEYERIWVNAAHTQWVNTAGEITYRRAQIGQGQYINNRGEIKTSRSQYTVITDPDRWRILRQYSSGSFTGMVLAKEYCVSVSTIYGIVSGLTWPFIAVVKHKTKH